MHLAKSRRLELAVQNFLGWIAFPLLFLAATIWFKWILKYQFRDLKKRRADFHALLDRYAGKPILICANHLTLIDSPLMNWALVGFWKGFLHPSRIFWHVPELRNFSGFPKGQICYLGKCLFIERLGPKEKAQLVLNKIKWVTLKKSLVIIFPEGARSRTGYVDTENFQYGVGEIIRDIPDCHVMCLYMRSQDQKNFSNIPPRGQPLEVMCEMLTPKTALTGLRANRDLSQQVIAKLADMERRYFEQTRK